MEAAPPAPAGDAGFDIDVVLGVRLASPQQAAAWEALRAETEEHALRRAWLTWRAAVVDDRPDFADPARLPFAERAITCDFHDVTSAVLLDADTYAVIATRGHQHDVELAAQLAPLSLRYLGMLGSRRKVAMTAGVLRSWSVAEEAIDRMHAPVGLSIGADTPEEIAISVVAEMIAVRRDGSRRRGGVQLGVAEVSQ